MFLIELLGGSARTQVAPHTTYRREKHDRPNASSAKLMRACNRLERAISRRNDLCHAISETHLVKANMWDSLLHVERKVSQLSIEISSIPARSPETLQRKRQITSLAFATSDGDPAPGRDNLLRSLLADVTRSGCLLDDVTASGCKEVCAIVDHGRACLTAIDQHVSEMKLLVEGESLSSTESARLITLKTLAAFIKGSVGALATMPVCSKCTLETKGQILSRLLEMDDLDDCFHRHALAISFLHDLDAFDQTFRRKSRTNGKLMLWAITHLFG